MSGTRRLGGQVARSAFVGLLGLLGVTLAGPPASAYSREPFPHARPANRDQAIGLLRANADGRDAICLTSRIQSYGHSPFGEAPAVRRAVELLQQRGALSREQIAPGPGGTTVRFTTAGDAFDRLDPTDRDGDGRPDVLQATLEGIGIARRILIDQLGLPAPGSVEVLMVRMDDRVSGYAIPAGDRADREIVVLNASPAGGVASARRAAMHHYTHAVASVLPPVWGEALATWTELASGKRIASPLARMARRLNTLSAGLLADDLASGPGNAVWLAFLDEAYGPAAVRLTLEELASGGPVDAALDNALRRSGTGDLRAALREFHLWAVLTGERADEHHFSFASRLSTPPFASSVHGLPALSVQADPAVAPLGATQVQLDPMSARGGLRVHFEGEFAARWEADLLLFDARGSVRRLALELVEGRGDVTVPVDEVVEALLLVRNLGSDDGEARHYSYSAQNEKGYPFVITAATATPTDTTQPGVMVSWETASEQQLLAFNVLRTRADSDGGLDASAPATRSATRLRINPVWIPALGDGSRSTGYRYLDRGVEPGVNYVYRIEGITRDGLTAISDPFALTPSSSDD